MPSVRLLTRLSDHLAAMHEARSFDSLAQRACDALSDLIDGADPVVSLSTTFLPPLRFTYPANRRETEARVAGYLSVAHEDPVYTARLRLLLDQPASLTAMVPRRDLERTNLYRDWLRPMGYSRLIRYPSPGITGLAVDVARASSREFSRADLAVTEAVGRHIESVTLRLAREHDHCVPIGEERYPIETFAWFVCDEAGQVLRMTPEARARYRECDLDGDANLVPQAWVEELRRRSRGEPGRAFWHTFEGRPMSVHVAPIRPTPNEYSVGFLIRAAPNDPIAPLVALGLSERQADVLHWVSQGKTNADVGVILGISALTVKKHLESIYHTLGVENRTAAVVRAMEARSRPSSASGGGRSGSGQSAGVLASSCGRRNKAKSSVRRRRADT